MNRKILSMIHFPLTFVMTYAVLSIDSVVASAHQVDERELNSRIIGGSMANAKRYPYYTHLNMKLSSGASFFCGGSLVNPDMVLTAAHCLVSDVSDPIIEVLALVNYTQSVAATGALTGFEFARKGKNFFWHPRYKTTGNANDVGLVLLDSPVLGVPLVKVNSDASYPSVGFPVTAIGHGRVSNAPNGPYPYYLMEVSIAIVSFLDCNDSNSYNGKINQSMICAGASNGGKGTCVGDGGGPLIVKGLLATNQDVQVGIASFDGVKGCAIKNFPSGFTRVSYFREWIDYNICYYSNLKPKFCSPSKNPTRRSPTKQPTPLPTLRKIPSRRPTFFTEPPTLSPSIAPYTPSPVGILSPTKKPSRRKPTRFPTQKKIPTRQPNFFPEAPTVSLAPYTPRPVTASPFTLSPVGFISPTKKPTSRKPTRLPTRLPTRKKRRTR